MKDLHIFLHLFHHSLTSMRSCKCCLVSNGARQQSQAPSHAFSAEHPNKGSNHKGRQLNESRSTINSYSGERMLCYLCGYSSRFHGAAEIAANGGRMAQDLIFNPQQMLHWGCRKSCRRWRSWHRSQTQSGSTLPWPASSWASARTSCQMASCPM